MRIKGLYIVIGLFVLGVLCASSSCKKVTTLTQGGVLTFSNDTLKFDTLFTTQGSYTNIMLIYNPQSEAVVVSSVRMAEGANSYFHLNVDGFAGNNAQNIKIAPHDSVYVFATVNINPNDTLTPFLITDSLVAVMNGQTYYVPFTAYGQNAHFIIGDSLGAGHVTWLTDKPYVVIHNCVLGPGAQLDIPRGGRVYMHQDAQFVVWPSATLNIGQVWTAPITSADSVVFQGDRLDRSYFGYQGYPGEWCGIWYLSYSNGAISNAVIKNCGNGAAYEDLYVQPAAIRVDDSATVRIDHSIIENSISLGVFDFEGTLTMTACNVNTTGGQALAVVRGGTDSFVNCTFANYGSSLVSHAAAGTVVINDWFTPDNITFYYGNLNVVMENCIVYGSLDSEITCDTTGSNRQYNANLQVINCLLKMGQVREPFMHFTDTIFNKDPMFKNTGTGDFSLSGSSSPAWGTGLQNNLPTNVLGNAWQGGKVDIGCY